MTFFKAAPAVLGMALATIPHSMYYAALAGILAKSFPPNIRYTGISLSYQLSSTVFAGTAPMMGQYLFNVTGSIMAVIVLGFRALPAIDPRRSNFEKFQSTYDLVLNATLGWSWADPVSALVIAALALKEGRDAWRGEGCCTPGTDQPPSCGC